MTPETIASESVAVGSAVQMSSYVPGEAAILDHGTVVTTAAMELDP